MGLSSFTTIVLVIFGKLVGVLGSYMSEFNSPLSIEFGILEDSIITG